MRPFRSLLVPLAGALAGALATPRPAPLAAQAPATSPRDSLVVSTAWLARQLADPALVLLHVGDRAEYDARHLPGARFVSLRDVSEQADGLSLQMPTPDALRERLAALGIADGSRVVVYSANESIPAATRLLFTLDHAGLGARASLLDGGMRAWVRDGHPVTADVAPARVGTLAPLRVRADVVDAAFVRAKLGAPGFAIVDARASAFYDGVQTGGTREQPHRAGHVAGALSVPFSSLTDERAHLRPTSELAALFARAGVRPGDTVVAYCHIGQQATAVVLAARTLGHPVLLYDGSYEDWSRRAELPVENPSLRTRK